ncbi:MAG: hypothetical protein PHP62_04895 [Candidatus Moranbacteria bacterium]|nr:hypothetical protein [Candidatus Moranbacteria bacterium]
MCIASGGFGGGDRFEKEFSTYAKNVANENRKKEGIVVFLKALAELLHRKK